MTKQYSFIAPNLSKIL